MSTQVIINALIASGYYLLMGIGFSLIFRVCRFIKFTHGFMATFGAYLSYVFMVCLEWNIIVALLVATFGTLIFSLCLHVLIYAPLRKQRTSSLVLMIASLGLYICMQNFLSMVFGDSTRTIRTGVVEEGINVLGARITPVQIVTICVSVVLVIALSIFLKRTKIGKSMRAVANDPELANVSGINSNRVILWAFAIGSGLAGLAGILVALDVDMTPTMGMHALLMGVVAMIIGGINSIPGIALGALLLAMAQHSGAWYIGSQWQDAIAFIILIVFLLFKPEGFLGKKVKAATV
ncbi:MAG: branched-chain amino acid ABC transporter permease [Promethearchaeota archaeon]